MSTTAQVGLGWAAAPHAMERHCTFSPKGPFRQALRGQSGGVGWMELSSETQVGRPPAKAFPANGSSIWLLGSGGIPNAASGFPPLGHPVPSNPCSAPPGHLTDNHLSDFLKRCRAGLRPNGIVVIKDNMAQEGVIMDDVDSSVCRDLDVVRKIIRRAGLHLLAEERQENFPDEIYHVYTFAMR